MLQIGCPVFLSSLSSTVAPVLLGLSRNSEGKPHHHDEAFIRDLIHRAPEILPIPEIEPIFHGARAICIELPNPAGFADNLLVTPEGGIVIVECKLQRNLQARREVVAQIMDYAAQLQSWSFADLDDAVRRAGLPDGGKPEGLVEAFKHHEDFDPIVFMDAITRNLRRGRMLLLVVGDGIREGLESLVGIVQRHPGFHAALGLIELKLFQIPQGGFIVQPRTLLRTLNIERGVVTFSDDRFSISPPPMIPDNSAGSPANRRPSSLTEVEYYTTLASRNPDMPNFVKRLVQRLEEIGLSPEFKRSLIMRWTSADGRPHSIINIRKYGRVVLEALSWQLRTEAEKALAYEFRQKIAGMLGGEVRGSDTSQNVWIDDRVINIEDFSSHEDDLIQAVESLIAAFQDLEKSQELQF